MQRGLDVILSIVPFVISLVVLTNCQNEKPTEVVEQTGLAEVGEVTRFSEGLSNPESFQYDPLQDLYFVSNVNGDSAAVDGNGFISRIDPNTGQIESRWIDGTREDVTLNAPKGIAMDDQFLWVTDISVVRRFDRETGAEAPPIAIPGSLFLNGIARGAQGEMYVSDSGMPSNEEGPDAKHMDAVYRISRDGQVETLVQGQDLMRPNGLAFVDGQLWTVTYGGNSLYRATPEGKQDIQSLPNGSLDGLIRLPSGEFLVSSWDVNGIFRGRLGGAFDLVWKDIQSPADIGFDSKRNLLLVPEIMASRISLYPLTPRDN